MLMSKETQSISFSALTIVIYGENLRTPAASLTQISDSSSSDQKNVMVHSFLYRKWAHPICYSNENHFLPADPTLAEFFYEHVRVQVFLPVGAEIAGKVVPLLPLSNPEILKTVFGDLIRIRE